MIEAKGLHVTFNPGTPMQTRAMRGIDLTISEGEFVTVIGSNGAGKSTFLNALAGEIIVDHGHIVIDGDDVTKWPTARRAGRVARVFQDPLGGSCANLTIAENMALAASRGKRRRLWPALTHTMRETFKARIHELDLGLENRLNDKMELLSGGQRQAVSLLMATLRPMKILLLDEHTAALDPKTAAFILDLTRTIVRERRLTTVMVTHSMRQALDIGDRTVMLHEGRVVLDVSGSERRGLTIEDLLHMFEKVRGETIDDDALLLG
ncbi:ABC transporter ATP-binding protein [Varunaivibrio sulfuroxidans]|uniref:Putative ABC transport system ATP-binding protein n=1 Tax=Varunaivibrio sulfuroxidans TaxID=1773489 RepID=A0A4R3J6K6_9PROT|nr:ABC transporter ATP-binding protein [Varunaivibrio sulfuroxidans]TCS61002.1 putative ABC transport system ATP-binding protein [Varunaivibrio sulfuroxidans]WES31592.1 ABC transporter ATP-binding protein [Varunaivibrio sulfuroxidans]